MMKCGSIIFVFNVFLFLFASTSGSAQQKEFGWLIGTWKLNNKNVYEVWKASGDASTLEGISYKIKGTDTLVTERLIIKFETPFFVYISNVAENPTPVTFKITQYNTDKFLAENPQHDFPKAIRYKYIRKDNQDFLEASIEGDDKVIPYFFTKVK